MAVVQLLVQGGKASAAELGRSLGPLGINISEVMAEINKQTKAFEGVQIPVKVITEDKTFKIEVGKPAVSELLKIEAKIEKGSPNPLYEKIANLKIEQIIKIALNSKATGNITSRVKQVLGVSNSMGILVEGKSGKELAKEIDKGAFKEKILAKKTELTEEELKELEEQKRALLSEVEKRKLQLTSLAKQIIESMAGQPRAAIKAKLLEAKIPSSLINELLPAEAIASPSSGAESKK